MNNGLFVVLPGPAHLTLASSSFSFVYSVLQWHEVNMSNYHSWVPGKKCTWDRAPLKLDVFRGEAQRESGLRKSGFFFIKFLWFSI